MARVNTLENNPLGDPKTEMTDRFWTTPNVLTVLRIILTPVFLFLIFADSWYYKMSALLVFTLASLTDFYDGRIARRDGTITSFGRFMDPLADKLLVSSALIAFVMLVFLNIRIVSVEFSSQPAPLFGDVAYWVMNALVGVVTLLAVVSGVRYLIENRKSF